MKLSRSNKNLKKSIAILFAAISVTVGATPGAKADLFDGSGISIKIISPRANAVVKDLALPIIVSPIGFTIDSGFAGTSDTATVGHYHEFLDGKLVNMAPLRIPTRDTISLVGVKKGKLTLMIVPARNDHSLIMSGASSVSFTYSGKFIPLPVGNKNSNQQNISITSPAAGSTINGTSFDLTVRISNFLSCLSCFGKKVVARQGHWHIFVDRPIMENMLTMASGFTQEVSLKGITPGVHTFWAVLVDNLHSPFMDQRTRAIVDGTATSIELNVAP